MSSRAELPTSVRAVVEATLGRDAHTTTEVRRAVEARAAVLSGGVRREHHVPPALSSYVDKVALHAYRITDDDVRALEAAGYSEDEVFEVTLCAALGAGLARFERGLAALAHVRRTDAATNSRSGTYP